MLNRRHLRIKVLQSLYAWFQLGDNDYAKGEKEMMKSIDRIYDLYIWYLLVFGELRVLAQNRIEEARNKKLPTSGDLNPNLKFSENAVVSQLHANMPVQAEAKKRKISWSNDQEIIRKLYSEIKQSEAYEKYMRDPGRNFEDDKEFVLEFFRENIANSESFLNYFEEKSISWLDDIDLVCAAVIKSIKGLNETSDAYYKLSDLYKDEAEDAQFVKDLFRKVINNNTHLEELISSKTENWELERIATMDMLLMKMAITEVTEFPTIPVKVTLNEYIEISKFYSTPKSNGFINGILDKVFAELRANGQIKKVGRGLIED